MRSSLRPNPSDVVNVTSPRSRSRRPIGATAVTTAPPAGLRYASAAVRSPSRTRSVASDQMRPTLEAVRVAALKARVRRAQRPPARAAQAARVAGRARVEPDAGDGHVGVAGVGVDGHPAARAG